MGTAFEACCDGLTVLPVPRALSLPRTPCHAVSYCALCSLLSPPPPYCSVGGGLLRLRRHTVLCWVPPACPIRRAVPCCAVLSVVPAPFPAVWAEPYYGSDAVRQSADGEWPASGRPVDHSVGQLPG